MTRTKSLSLAIVATLLLPMAANADLIIDQSQTSVTGAWTPLNAASSWSQEFVAGEDNTAGAGIYLLSFFDWATSGNLMLEILDDTVANAGNVVASGSTAFNSVDDWVDVFWSATALTVGSTYYLRVSGDSNTAYAYASGNQYSSGEVHLDSGFVHNITYDLAFRTYYDNEFSVPEPGTLALFGLGLLGMGAARRRKKA